MSENKSGKSHQGSASFLKRFVILRICAHCEWIFRAKNNGPVCPKCQFGSYGARYVYGDKAYTYARTQKPWKDKKMFSYEMKLNKEIQAG